MGTRSEPKPVELIAIDPGGTCGWAVFGSNGELLRSGHAKILKMLEEVVADPDQIPVIIEKPKFRGHNNRSPIDDLIQLSIRTGELSGLYRSLGGQVELVWPTDWKGSTPKKISHNRIRQALTEEELERLDKDHNAMDAVGIGLWKTGRMRR